MLEDMIKNANGAIEEISDSDVDKVAGGFGVTVGKCPYCDFRSSDPVALADHCIDVHGKY